MKSIQVKVLAPFIGLVILLLFFGNLNVQTALWNGNVNTHWYESANRTFAARGALTNPATPNVFQGSSFKPSNNKNISL